MMTIHRREATEKNRSVNLYILGEQLLLAKWVISILELICLLLFSRNEFLPPSRSKT